MEVTLRTTYYIGISLAYIYSFERILLYKIQSLFENGKMLQITLLYI